LRGASQQEKTLDHSQTQPAGGAQKAKGSSKHQAQEKLAAAQKEAQLAADRAAAKQFEDSETVLRKRVGKSASIKRKRK